MNASVQSQEGRSSTLYMGCYGIGVSRIVAAAIEQNNDEKGIVWPVSIAPFDVNIIAIGFDKNEKVANAATDLYEKLSNQGYDVILDDRKAGFGAKIKDSELIGIPMNIIIGKLYVEKNEIEMRTRDGQISLVQIDDLEVIFNHFK